MKKRKVLLSLISVVLLLAMAVGVLSACNNNKPQQTTYTVTFQNGEDVVNTLTDIAPGTALTAEQIPTLSNVPEDKVFDGWYIGEGEAAVKVEAGYKVNGNVIAVAKLSDKPVVPVTYTVTFKNGETVVDTVENIAAGSKLTAEQIPTLSVADDKVFEGWFVGDQVFDTNYAVNSNVVAVAKISDKPVVPVTYTVTFKNGETVVDTVENIAAGSKLTAEQIPTLSVADDKVFEGWFVGDQVFDTNYVVNGNVVAVAKLSDKPVQVTIEFKVDVDSDPVKSVTVDEGTALVADQIPAGPTVPGKNFLGWYIGVGDNAVKVEVGYKVTDNVSAFAEYEDVFPGFDEDMIGTWESQDGTVKVVITASTITYNSSNGTALSTSYGNYYFTVEDTKYVIYLDIMTTSGHLYVGVAEENARIELSNDGWDEPAPPVVKEPVDVEIPDKYVGTWVGTGVTIVVSVDGLTVNDVEAVFYEQPELDEYRGGTMTFEIEGETFCIVAEYSGLTLYYAQDDFSNSIELEKYVEPIDIDSKYFGEYSVGEMGDKLKVEQNAIIYRENAFEVLTDYPATNIAVREAGGYTFAINAIYVHISDAALYFVGDDLYFYNGMTAVKLTSGGSGSGTVPDAIAIPDELQGTTWAGGNASLVFGTATIQVNLGNGVKDAILTAVDSQFGDLTLYFDGRTWTFWCYTDREPAYYELAGDSIRLFKVVDTVEFNSTLIGTWTNEDASSTIVITPDSFIYDGKTATNVSVDEIASLGYYLTVDGVEYNVYYQSFGKKLYVKNVETEAEVSFTKAPEPISVTFPESFWGTWTDEDEQCELIIDEHTLTVNGTVAVIYEVGGFSYYDDWTFTVNDNEWGIRVYIYSGVVTLSVSDNQNNYYDCNKEETTQPPAVVVIDDEYVGEYDIADTGDKLIITVNGITYVDNTYDAQYVATDLKVRTGGGYEFHVPDYYAYDAAVYFKSGKLYFYKDSNSREYELTSETGNQPSDSIIPADLVGTWQSANFSDASQLEGDLTVVITATTITINDVAADEIVNDDGELFVTVGDVTYVISYGPYEDFDYMIADEDYSFYYALVAAETGNQPSDSIIPADLVGTWQSAKISDPSQLEGDLTVVITATTITINDVAAEDITADDWGDLSFEIDGVEYTISSYGANGYMISFGTSYYMLVAA